MRHAVVLVLLGACGRIGFTAQSDATSSDGALGAFSAPMPIAELNSASEDDDPTLTDDELEIYFTSTRPNDIGEDIWRSQRASTSDPWGTPTNVAELNTAASEATPELTSDGLTIFLARDGGATGTDIFVSTRAARDQPWSVPVPVTELVSNNFDWAAATSPDQLTMIFTRGAPLTDAQLLLTTRASVGNAWSTPVVVLDVTGQQENQAWLDEVDIYYTINSSSLQTIYRADRIGSAGFGPPVAIPEIDLAGSESDPWLSPSTRAIYFEHEDDLYVAYR
jgi:hypothetical protein